MKVLIGHWGHEANTYAEEHATFEVYTGRGLFLGEESIRANEGTPSYLGGIIRACREEGIEMIPTCAYTAAAPVLTHDCTQRMLDSILSVCKERRDEIDGICLALHGAGVSEDHDDLEYYVLKKIREVVGENVPITVPMDLHGNISTEFASIANGLFGIRKYPHTDKADASYLAMKTLARILRKELETETAVVHLPLQIPISAGLTQKAPFPELEEIFASVIEKEGLVDASLFHGFPYADVASGGASVVVVAEKGKGAEVIARRLAKEVWEKRHYFKIQSLSAAEAMDLAEQETREGYLVINEMSDNPGGGCPGDGTHLLREMLKRNLPGTIFGYVVDPAAAEFLFEHRPGDSVSFSLGGKHEAIFGAPLKLENAKILNLSDGVIRHTSPSLLGVRSTMGKTARVRVGNVDIIIGSARNQTFDDRPFVTTGADLKDYRYVGLKSTQHFRSFFEGKAARIISCDPPGLNSGDLSVFTYKKTPRPFYPLDPETEFQ